MLGLGVEEVGGMGLRGSEELFVPVAGGELAVHRWAAESATAPVLLAVHGITSNGLAWAGVADALPGWQVLAPDVRGRAGSRDAPAPYGLATHADDLLRVLDELGGSGPVVLAGHSMGAFVACVAAAGHPERFSRVVLVDGGLGFPVPTGEVDAVLDAVIGPAMRRLSMEFADVAAHRAFWREHPAFGTIWQERALASLDHDLVGEPPHLRSSCVLDAIRTDGSDVLVNPDVHAAIHRLDVPTTLVWAERGILNQPEGLYSPATLAALPDRIVPRLVPDTNHYSILLGDAGATTVAAEIAR